MDDTIGSIDASPRRSTATAGAGLRRTAALAVLVVLAAACTTPPGGGGGTGLCPSRSRTVVASWDLEHFEVPRAVSPNGQWVLTSRQATPAELELWLHSTDGSVPAELVGTEPSTTAIWWAQVADDGSRVLHGDRLWRRGDSPVDVVAPVVAPMAGFDRQDLSVGTTSAGAELIAWVERSLPVGASNGANPTYRTVITDVVTGDILRVVAGHPGGTSSGGGASPSATHSAWAAAFPGRDLVDLGSGAVQSLAPMRSAMAAEGIPAPTSLPNTWVWAVDAADGGLFVLIRAHRNADTRLYVWDVGASQLTRVPVAQDQLSAAVGIAPDGRVAYRIDSPTGTVVREFDPATGVTTPVAQGPLLSSERLEGISLPATPDLRSVAGTWYRAVPSEGADLAVARCT
jgi:hypothetical protein